ncbi:ribonuclease HII [Salegentibacter mishustinae]|uniref:ribonuclease HII n=1 Tax=Salegentibacter mishustinae TaxID=270918 RepID=UPI001CE15634|nr:ribonuclease HII [Salegentibacter mishustinae]UBZ08523.1 ribonuclease HII [Salegentibacter mishustinae]
MLKMFNLPCQVAGTDEAGRGCLAGPVTAAAVILPKKFKNKLLNDSKQIKELDRNGLKEIIINEALSYGIAHVYMEEIDKINILNASILAMHRAIEQLHCEPEHIIVDGNKFKPFRNISHDCIIKGDGKFLSIAAASILAKTARDEFMKKIHQEFPMYNWQKNKGYPTREHRQAIMEFGSTPYHRKSFKLLPEQLKLTL